MRRALLGSLLALLLVGCSGGGSDNEPTVDASTASPSSTVPTQQPASIPAAPRISACYQLSLSKVTRPTNNSLAVRCTGPHTTRTIHVGTLDTLVDGHALAVDSDRVQEQLSTTCPAKLAALLGGSVEDQRLSRFQVVWFSPTLMQADRGANWFRCDAIAFGKDDALLPLPTRQGLRGILDRPSALDRFGLCGTAQPGAEGFERVACALPHTWVAEGTIPIAGGPAYPGTAAVRTAGDSTCADQVREATGFPLEFTYGWEWPTKDQWVSGQRYGFCWAPSD